MRIDARRDVIEVRVGPTFAPEDAARLQEAVASLGPFSRLVVDFGEVRDCDDAALVLIATLLGRVPGGRISLSGLTQHQRRLLAYLGLAPERRDGAPAARA